MIFFVRKKHLEKSKTYKNGLLSSFVITGTSSLSSDLALRSENTYYKKKCFFRMRFISITFRIEYCLNPVFFL